MNCLRFIFAILCAFTFSCAQRDDIDRPASKKTGSVHTVRKDGIEFRLNLLNEQGEPAVTFREGENLALHFEMENLREGDGREYPNALYCELRDLAGLGNIFTLENEFVCSIKSRILCTAIGRTFPFDKENKFTMHVSLQEAADSGASPPVVLPKGACFAGFTYTFSYRIPPETWVEVGPVTMKIDFTIE